MIWPVLSVFEIIFFAIFGLLLIIGTSFDRKGVEEPKWYVLGIGFIICIIWFWSDWTFFGIWSAVQTRAFWEPFFWYVLLGLAYSGVEFTLAIKRFARYYKERWETFLNSSPFHRRDSENLQDLTVRQAIQQFPDEYAVKIAVKEFIQERACGNMLVRLDYKPTEGIAVPEPTINKSELIDHVTAWTFFWPLYLVSLVVGDLLTQFFEWTSEFIIAISGRFVRWTFDGVFKV